MCRQEKVIKMEMNISLWRKKKKSINQNNADIQVVNAISSLTYPGALVKANSELVENQPDVLPVKRDSLTLSIDLPGMTNQDNKIVVKKCY